MTILEYLKSQSLIDSNNELTSRAEYLGYSTLEQLKTDIEETYIIDFKTKTIIPAYRYTIYPIAITGETQSDYLNFRAYNNTNITNGINILGYTPEILWKNGDQQGIIQITEDPTIVGNIITFKWPLTANILIQSGKLEFAVRFVEYETATNNGNEDQIIIYNLSTLPISLSIQSGMNYIDNRTYNNPFSDDDIVTYIIDGGQIVNE